MAQDEEKFYYKIGELEAITGIPSNKIRYWTKKYEYLADQLRENTNGIHKLYHKNSIEIIYKINGYLNEVSIKMDDKKINDLNLIKSALEKKEEKSISIKIATKGNALKLLKMAEKNAKEALTRKIFESETNVKLLDQIADKFKLNISPRTVEVFDNSHIQGSNSVGTLITFGAEGFVKKRYRKFYFSC